MNWDAIWVNGLITTCEQGYGCIEEGAIAVKEGKISWLGKAKDLPARAETLAKEVFDLAGQCLTPGFIDCHTHLVYAANRANEFEMRLQGASYAQIAQQGGGIQSTVLATRVASAAALFQQSIKRAACLLESGVTTLEIKSGYGLDWETEKKILTVAKKINETLPLDVHCTFLGAHTVPLDYRGREDSYVDLVCEQMIPDVAKLQLASAVDVFCEKIAFNLIQTERIFACAKQHNLAIKCHAEQLSDLGGAALAAKYQALSVDHLEYVSEKGVGALAAAGTVAVLLPGAFYFLREKQVPPISWLRQYNVPMAIASDCNPGTSPVLTFTLVLNMACTLFGLTPEEALLGVTYHAAQALGVQQRKGSLAVGKDADFAIWEIEHPRVLSYYIGLYPLHVIKNGLTVI